MQPKYENQNIRARCPDCEGAVTTFESKSATSQYGVIVQDGRNRRNGVEYARSLFVLARCAGCGRGGLAKLLDNGNMGTAVLESFHPAALDTVKLPKGLPDGVMSEFREAELCASSGAWRAASGMFRSTLEKLLKDNGYSKGTLASRIDQAAADGVITQARKRRAHEDVRVLGNDVLHDEWREVTHEEVELAHHYVQRISEDLYDDRASVEEILRTKGRIETPQNG